VWSEFLLKEVLPSGLCVCMYTVRPNSSVNGTRKQTNKEDTNKLNTLAFKMIPILHNTLLATPKLKFYSGEI
jgi:hypothetical protein